MKQSKRVLAMILALVMVISMVPVSVFAAEVPTFSISSVSGNPGDEVEVKVSISNNPGMMVMNYEIVYDTTRLERVEFTGYGMDGGVWTIGENTNKALWDHSADSTFNGDVMTLKFKIKADAPVGDALISIKDFDIVNENDDEISPNLEAGKVVVVSKPVTGISLDKTTLALDQGATATLTATVEPADAGDKTVTWTTSDDKVATVSDGVVTAVGAGTATITAKAGDFSATCEVTVAGANVPVTGITLDKSAFYVCGSEVYVMEGNSAALTATVTPDYATDKTVTWTSSDESIATVADGVVVALKSGSVTITAKAGEVETTCVITVIDNPFTMTADDETVAFQYTGGGSNNSKPTSLRYYRVEVPTGTKIVKLSGPMTTDWSMSQTLKDNLADGVITIDLSTYGRSGDCWKIDMISKNGYYWGAQHIIQIYMIPCDGEHTFADATCTKPQTCTVCYTTQGEALGHDLSQTAAEVPADCDTAGTTAVMGCSRCDHTEGGTEIAALGHLWKSTGVNPQPTCTETGTESFICMRTLDCDGAKTETVAALGHNWNEGNVTTEPTCTEKGEKSFICLVDGCNGTKTEEVAANGHSYVDGYCSVCTKKEPTLIPFTKANHTDSGEAIHSKFTGVVGLEVDGVTLADWSEWVQGGNYQTQSITIYVAAEDKDKEVTFTLLLADGQTGSGALINQTATVQLNSGVGSYSATRMKIGTGGLAPQLNLHITFKHELCEEHNWVEATCTTPKTCTVCALTEGEALGHTWNEGTVTTEPSCTNTGVKSFKCTVDGCDGTKTETLELLLHNFVEGTCQICKGTTPFTIKSGDTTLSPVQIDAVNCTKAEKNVATFDLTVPEGTTSLDFSGGNFYLYNAETHKSLVSNKTSYTLSLTNGCISVCYRDRSSKTYYHINILHTWKDATCTAPKTCANCSKTEGEALGHDWTEAGTCTRCNLANTITEIEISHPSIDKNEETGALTMAMVAGASEKIDVSAAVVDSTVASTQVVAWFSSDETVATVVDGMVTALKAGTATITAKAVDASGIALLADEEVLVQFTLTVTDPAAGYTVTMGDDYDNAVIGSTISVPVTIGHTGDVTVYNAFDFTFTYDPAVLELTSTEIEGMNVTAANGKIHVERYGEDLTVGSAALTLTFNAIATGETNVKVTTAKVDISASALTNDAPDAAIIDNITLVTIAGYTVTLPEDFTGESSILPDEDYTFEAKDKNYDYTIEATIDGNPIEVTDNGDGTYTIPADKITGNIVITSTKEPKKFEVQRSDDIEGDSVAQYMTDYTATLTKEDKCSYDIKVSIDGNEFTGFEYDSATGVITIPGEYITGKITIDSGKEELPADTYTVTFEGDGAGEAVGEKTATEGKPYTFTINNIAGVTYNVTYTMGDAEAVELTSSEGKYTIENVTDDLVITIEKITDLEVEVTEYVTLNGKTMFLVTATQTLPADEALSYGGSVMFYSNQYNAWAFLVITEDTLSVEDAKAEITHSVAQKTELYQTYNVNETANNTVDINDAQLVFDMYNNEYQDFTNATMQKFLKADVNGDKVVNVTDAAAIVAQIVAAK